MLRVSETEALAIEKASLTVVLPLRDPAAARLLVPAVAKLQRARRLRCDLIHPPTPKSTVEHVHDCAGGLDKLRHVVALVAVLHASRSGEGRAPEREE